MNEHDITLQVSFNYRVIKGMRSNKSEFTKCRTTKGRIRKVATLNWMIQLPHLSKIIRTLIPLNKQPWNKHHISILFQSFTASKLGGNHGICSSYHLSICSLERKLVWSARRCLKMSSHVSHLTSSPLGTQNENSHKISSHYGEPTQGC